MQCCNFMIRYYEVHKGHSKWEWLGKIFFTKQLSVDFGCFRMKKCLKMQFNRNNNLSRTKYFCMSNKVFLIGMLFDAFTKKNWVKNDNWQSLVKTVDASFLFGMVFNKNTQFINTFPRCIAFRKAPWSEIEIRDYWRVKNSWF